MTVTMEPIGIVHSCFKEKFGIPRQPGLVTEAKGTIEFFSPYNCPEAVSGLGSFSHLWVIFLFHGILSDKWRPSVRPPRLGGNKRCGVFATRSTHRPNSIGMSVVRLESVEMRDNECCLAVSGLDILDGTPVLDVKPYIPYVDAVTDAQGGFAGKAPEPVLTVSFTQQAAKDLENLPSSEGIDTRCLIEQVIGLDPRPAYHQATGERDYGVRLLNFNVRWRVVDNIAEVFSIDIIDLPGLDN